MGFCVVRASLIASDLCNSLAILINFLVIAIFSLLSSMGSNPGLDPISMAVICDLIRSLNDALGATSIIVTHDVAETFSFADYIYFLADGKIAAEGTPKQLLASRLPFVRQFIHSEKDGPVPFHVEAPSYKVDLQL